jgi:hypothetical protein
LDSEDEVCDELSSLRKENEELVDLLDNRDNMLREAKKLKILELCLKMLGLEWLS